MDVHPGDTMSAETEKELEPLQEATRERAADDDGGLAPSTPSAVGTCCVSTSERCRAVRGMSLLAVAFCLQFTAYNGLGNMQSSLNRQEGMGVITQAIIYGLLVVSCFYLPR